MNEPHPYCLECDEPLDWCIHGDGSAWANLPVPELRPKEEKSREETGAET